MNDTTSSKTDSKQAALGILQQGVTDLMTSDGWKRALDFKQRFHNYSFFNTNLIQAQRPDAQLVAGYRAWQAADRQVRKGERGITILAPLLRPDPDNPKQRILTGFRAVHVFDVSQTDGEPIPQPPTPQLLEDTPEDRAKLKGLDYRLATICANHGVSVSWDLHHPHALGMYQPSRKHISIKPGLSPTQTFKTLCHETAHMLLHSGNEPRAHAELEAETTAYLTCHALGINTSTYSFPYLAHWTDSLEDLIRAGDQASKTATTILNTLTNQQHDHDTDQAAA